MILIKKNFFQMKVFLKNLLIFLKPHIFFGFLNKPLLFLYNFLSISKWISNQKKGGIINDYYSPIKNYNKRIKLYEAVLESYNLQNEPIIYLEFGVFSGNSYIWWLNSNLNINSKFFGFDTFEGLPESWEKYKKGDFKGTIPQLDDKRAKFVKGLFQDTLFPFLRNENIDNYKKVIHLDADLFTSTLFVLTSLAPYLNKGDIIIFDEFNVPNHEFYAWEMFIKSYYVEYKLIGSVNNYFAVAFEIIKI